MLEREVERRLRDGVRDIGGLCLKLTCPGFTGVPDRMILLKGGVIAFAELKRPGQRERERQIYVQKRLRRLGFVVFGSVDGPERVGAVLTWCALHMAGEREYGRD